LFKHLTYFQAGRLPEKTREFLDQLTSLDDFWMQVRVCLHNSPPSNSNGRNNDHEGRIRRGLGGTSNEAGRRTMAPERSNIHPLIDSRKEADPFRRRAGERLRALGNLTNQRRAGNQPTSAGETESDRQIEPQRPSQNCHDLCSDEAQTSGRGRSGIE
jgi:hypothetical protein